MVRGTEVITFENPRRRLGYYDEFRQRLREQPGILKTAIKLMDVAESSYNPSSIHAGLFELGWNKEHEVWEEKVYNGKPLNPFPHNGVRLTTIGRSTFLKPGEPVTDKETGLQVIVLGKVKKSF